MSTQKNEMDKVNYPKTRLQNSLALLSQYMEAIPDGDEKDEADLHLAFIIEELATKPPFIISDKTRVCSYCNAKHSTHTITFSSFHLGLLTKIFNHVVSTGNYNFCKDDLPSLSHTEYGNFCQLQRFGLLFFQRDEEGKKLKKWYWGMPVKEVYKFLNGEKQISASIVRDTISKLNIPSDKKIYVSEVPKGRSNFSEIVPDFISYGNLENN